MDNVISILALDQGQTEWMLSLKRMKIQADINEEKDHQKQALKRAWRDQWASVEAASFRESFSTGCTWTLDTATLMDLSKRLMADCSSKVWYYLAVMEAELFEPYYPLYGEEDADAKEKNKQFKGLKFKQKDYIKTFLTKDGQIPESFVDRVKKCYKDAVAHMSGRYSKIAIGTLTALLASAAVAATAGAMAPSIAVALVGSNFAGFHGAALTSACLALLGGGSIAAGGAGVAGGVVTIVGGGALLGLAVGGTTSATVTALALATPQAALSMAAKLEVTVREVLLNAQNDTAAAQQVLTKYKEELNRLKHSVVDLEEHNNENKQQIKALKATIGYLTRSAKSLEKFTSSYEIGLQAENEE